MEKPTSRIERIITGRRTVWAWLVISLALMFFPLVAAYFDGALDEILGQGQWRVFYLAPIIILYILVVAPVVSRSEAEVIRSIRPLVELDDEEFAALVNRVSQINPRYEWLAIVFGLVLGLVSAWSSGFDDGGTWLRGYWLLSISVMYGLLAWVILGAYVSSRLTSAIYRQTLKVDILDQTPFEAIGRQSLLLALVFIGGITLSQLITFRPENISSLSFWVGYLLLVLIILLIFFVNMRPTHRLLSAAKVKELQPLQQQINLASRELLQLRELNQDTGSLPAEISALVTYEQRLLAARTWPYNTAILRTLFFSVLIPLGSVLARLIIEVFLR